MSNYQNQNINTPIYINGSLTTQPTILIGQEPYLLEKYDFGKIINGNDYSGDIKSALKGATLGLFLNMISKLIGNKIDKTILFDKWEVYAFGISFILLIVLFIYEYISNKFYPTEKRKIINKIKMHFNI